MKFNFKQLKDAVAHMGYDISSAGDTLVVDIELIGENPGEGELVECLRVSATYIRPATNYSKASQVSKSLEIYADPVQKRPRYAETTHSEI